MRYVDARIDQYTREEAYRIFVTKSLQLAPQNKFLQTNYSDLFKPQSKEPDKTGGEIVTDIMKKAGLTFRKD